MKWYYGVSGGPQGGWNHTHTHGINHGHSEEHLAEKEHQHSLRIDDISDLRWELDRLERLIDEGKHDHSD